MGATLRSPSGRAAPGSAGLPTGNGGVQRFDLFGFELAATVLLPLGMDPYAESVFPLRIALLVAGPVVAFLAGIHELVHASVQFGFLGSYPGVPVRSWDSGKALSVGCVKGALGRLGRRPFLHVFRPCEGEPILGRNPSGDLGHAGAVREERAAFGAGRGQMAGLELRVLAAGDENVVTGSGRLGPTRSAMRLRPSPSRYINTHSASGARRNWLSMMGVIAGRPECLADLLWLIPGFEFV